MLLKCHQEGCDIFTHSLCAEILDRCRVVHNNGARDVLAYKCEMHSYEGLDACAICKLGNRQEEMLECGECKQGYHMDCVRLDAIPEGDWSCAQCSNTTVESQDTASQDAQDADAFVSELVGEVEEGIATV